MCERNAVPQNVNFKCGMAEYKSSLRKLRNIYALQQDF